jgi:hypothetical protein
MEIDRRHTYIRAQIEDGSRPTRQDKAIVAMLEHLSMNKSVRTFVGSEAKAQSADWVRITKPNNPFRSPDKFREPIRVHEQKPRKKREQSAAITP